MTAHTDYNTPRPMGLPAEPTLGIVEVISRINGHNGCLADLHEQKHSLNMAAWNELYLEHLAAGRFEIAATIMSTKIIPNRA